MSKNKYSLAQLAAIYNIYKDLDPKTRTVNCCTCGKSLYIEYFTDCFNLWGHYIPRSVEPKLKFHPNNSFAQCVNCNMQVSSQVDIAYDKYMVNRFGQNIKQELINSDKQDDEYYKSFYTSVLLGLLSEFPDLTEVLVDTDTGEVEDTVEVVENPIEAQWDTYSSTYKQDLDELTRILKTEPIEYERF